MNLFQKTIKHFCLITKHKWNVFKLCVRVGEPVRGVLHDLSKYSWTEFWESVQYYNGTHSPIVECKKDRGYSKAWLHHKGRNKHHAEYWVDLNASDKTPMIPYKYVAEMLCDKMAAGMAYEGKKWTKEFELQYWMKEKDQILLNPNIKEMITDCLTQVSEKGIKPVYTKQNFKKLYEKYCVKH